MKQDILRVAIYSRKSKFTGKGESIANQIEECKKYCRYMLHQEEERIHFAVYEDEGYSGKNFQRPAMKKLLEDLAQYDFLVCYRLDRVSRSVSDFSNFIKRLELANVAFLSVSESFDTTKPMGRAMMNITSAFADLERDTITERIVDTMTALAKTGRWLGGTTPLGFESEKVNYERHGKSRSYFKLKEKPEELETIRQIFNKYIELGSLAKLSSYLMNHGILSRNGVNFSNYSLRFILKNPVYCTADLPAYTYLKEKDYSVYSKREAFTGKHGLIGYNKTNEHHRNGAGRFNETSNWILAVGEHIPVVRSSVWIQVQEQLQSQSKYAFRRARSNHSLLSGLLFCSCGSPMRPKSTGTRTEQGERRFSYLCETKSRSKGSLCRQKNIQGNALDESVVSCLFEMYGQIQKEDYNIVNAIKTELNSPSPSDSEEMLLKHSLEANHKKLDRLVHSMEHAASDEAASLLFHRIEEISAETRKQKHKLETLQQEQKTTDTAKLREYVKTMLHFDQNLWNLLDYDTQKNIIPLMIDHIEWDGTTATIFPCVSPLIQINMVQAADDDCGGQDSIM